jgi:glucose/arabinose dehydrogenase
VKLTILACGMNRPWGVATLPNGALLISERSGGVRLFHAGRLAQTPIEGSPTPTVSYMAGQLDVAVDPDFAANRLVYFTYVAGESRPPEIVVQATGKTGALHLVIASALYRNGRFDDFKILAETKPSIPDDHHFGGRIAFLPDGSLLVSTGDEYDRPMVAQEPKIMLGKILRIDRDGKVAVYARGLRNVQALAVEPGSGRIFAADHGPIGGDELNIIEPGGNYGWPLVTGGEYESNFKDEKNRPPAPTDARDPVFDWKTLLAPSGMAIYEGEMFPAWKGQLLVGGLAGQRIDRFNIASGTIELKGELLADAKRRIRDVAIAADGSILAVTDEDDGCLLQLSAL